MKNIYTKLYSRVRLLLTTDFLKFAISGMICVVIEFIILIVLVEKFSINYLIANFFSFMFTNLVNYLLSRLWVFGKSNKRIRHEVLLFFSTAMVGLIINQIIMWILVDRYQLNYKLVKFIAIVIVVIWNFWSKKFLVFSTIKKEGFV